MPKAIRYRYQGQFLQNTMFWTMNSDYLGAYHGVETDEIFDRDLAKQEEAMTIESHRQDFAVAFGIPAADIECVTLDWDGKVETLPFDDDAQAKVQRKPVAPVAENPSLEERVAALEAKVE